ncbi:hypothetical protein EXS54_02260 [Patescibacteria group bacterium]|nr:hypothetical protein [Patescibacteria group bacterium]
MATNKEVAQQLWVLWLVRSVILIVFGIFAVVWPGLTLVLIAVAFALFLIVAGIVDVITGLISIGKRSLWFLTLLLGVLEAGVGVYLLRHSLLELGVFIALVGLTFIVKGILEVISAFDQPHTGGQKTLMVLIGLIAVLAGVVILAHPVSGGLAFVWAIGLYGILAGAVGVALAIHARDEA